MTPIGPGRQRTVVFVVSFVVIAAEIALMRDLALRFWEHLAWLVVSVALLGFGVSGTLLLLLDRWFRLDRAALQLVALAGLACALPLSLLVGDTVELDLVHMAWQRTALWKVGLLELILAIPYLFAGMYIALALQDEPGLIAGHYGASFLGSGAGALLVLPGLTFAAPRVLILGCALLVMAAALLHGRDLPRRLGWLAAAVLLSVIVSRFPFTAAVSADKDLPQILAMAGSEVIARSHSPRGIVEVVDAPAVHAAPGLSLNYAGQIADQYLVALDATVVGSIYRCRSTADLAFLDHTTPAVAYRLNEHSRVLLGGVTGTAGVGLALYHQAETITALTDYDAVRQLLTGSLASCIGEYLGGRGAAVQVAAFRTWLRRPGPRYSLIVLPPVVADPGGLGAAAADSLLTVETFSRCFDRLEDDGIMTITTAVHAPPRESLRLLNLFIDAIAGRGGEPARQIAMIRNWSTVTLIVSGQPLTGAKTAAVRAFSRLRGFDLVWLPDMSGAEANRYHVLDEAAYHLAAAALLSGNRPGVNADYLYDISSPTDDRPFFRHFGRRGMADRLAAQLDRRSRAYAELGTMFLQAALVAAALLSLILILLPLLPLVGLPGSRSERFGTAGFFSAVGFGFMLLEMGVLQRFTVYLGHPVYAAAAVIAGFLCFGGVGSLLSGRLADPLPRRHLLLGGAIVAGGLLLLLAIDPVLAGSEGLGLAGRISVAMALIGPLAMLMGTMFPLGLRRLGRGPAGLIPWAWSANGFTSVMATLSAPLLALQAGFSAVAWTALACYGVGTVLSWWLPHRTESTGPPPPRA